MSKNMAIHAAGLLMVVLTGLPAAALTLSPPDADLGDLDHNTFLTWGINIAPDPTMQIVSAQLFLDDIYDWTGESNDILYVHLLDDPAFRRLGAGGTPSSKVTTGRDNENPSDAFAGQGRLLFTYTDTRGGLPSEDVRYTFTSDDLALLNTYWMNNGSVNGVFGFGFDPDCHYYNSGVYFTCEFGSVPPPPVPEPVSIVLMSMGLGGLALRRRFFA